MAAVNTRLNSAIDDLLVVGKTTPIFSSTYPTGQAADSVNILSTTSATFTFGEAHGLQQNDTVDVYWIVGGVAGIRYGANVDAVDGLDVTATGGTASPTCGNAVTDFAGLMTNCVLVPATAAFTRSSTCWAAGLHLESISPWNSYSYDQRAGTLVTAKHVVFAWHYKFLTGNVMKFAAADGTIYDRYITNQVQLSDHDAELGTLDSDLPATFQPCKLLPTDWRSYMPAELDQGLPVLVTDDDQNANVHEVAYWINRFGWSTDLREPQNGDRASYWEAIVAGDSGCPFCLVLDKDLILVSIASTSESGPFLGHLDTELAAATSGYSLDYVNLNDYSARNRRRVLEGTLL